MLRPVVELNARFTLGTVALGHARRALEAARSRGDLVSRGVVELAFALDGDTPPAQGALRVPLGAGRAALALARRSGADG
jgi:hypothetical protein